MPQINAQTKSIPEVNQKSVQVTIDDQGNIKVIHQIRNSNGVGLLKFVDGNVSNVEVINKMGISESIDIYKGIKSMPILESQGELFVKYDLSDALILKNDIWILDYRYLETTTFIIPDKVELFFVNERPVFLEGKNAFTCHGCEISLEFSVKQSKNLEYVNWENKNFVVEMDTLLEIENFKFDQPSKKISFTVNDENQYITTVVPLELLWGPYVVLLNDKKIFFSEYLNNGTHVWVNMKPKTTGEISIIGTTVVPEFPIIAPLSIGFLMIMIVPLIKKFNLR